MGFGGVDDKPFIPPVTVGSTAVTRGTAGGDLVVVSGPLLVTLLE